MDNLFKIFTDRITADLKKTSIQTPSGTLYSYAELIECVGRYARLLRNAGVLPGDRVAVIVEKTPQSVFLYLCCLQIGAVYLPLNNAYRLRELVYFLNDAQPAAIICDSARQTEIVTLELKIPLKILLTLDAEGMGSLSDESQRIKPLKSICARSSQDVAALLYTSGTTGFSKGAMLTHENLVSNALGLTQAWQLSAEDTLLHALPLFHVHGLFVALHGMLLNAAKIILLPKFEVEAIIRFLPQCTVFMGVPTYYARMLNDKYFNHHVCAHMRLFVSGSAPLPVDIYDRFRVLTGHTILERYGMTEAGMICSNSLEGPCLAGKVGMPLPGINVRITCDGKSVQNNEVGMLEVKGPNVFKGYWNRPDKTASEMREDGFFITGDLASWDDEGNISIVGRAKDLIITGGYNVYPKEIEILLDEIPSIQESAVIGISDADYGEMVVAVIVLKSGCVLMEDEIKRILKSQLVSYKIPKRFLFVSELPRNVMGKIQKNQLREQYA